MKAYSQDLRDRVVAACDAGRLPRAQIAAQFAVSTAWIRRLLQRRRTTGSYAALPQRAGRKCKIVGPDAQRLMDLVRDQPDATLAELRQRLDVAVSLGVVGATLHRLNLPRKKSRRGPASRTAPMSSSSGRSGGRPVR